MVRVSRLQLTFHILAQEWTELTIFKYQVISVFMTQRARFSDLFHRDPSPVQTQP